MKFKVDFVKWLPETNISLDAKGKNEFFVKHEKGIDNPQLTELENLKNSILHQKLGYFFSVDLKNKLKGQQLSTGTFQIMAKELYAWFENFQKENLLFEHDEFIVVHFSKSNHYE